MKLYEFPPTRSIRVRWALQEIGVAFESEVIDMKKGSHRSPSFLAVNPAGKLPALVDGDLTLTESVAIVIYLSERFPDSNLLPTALAARAEAMKWMLFTATELEQPLWRIARHTSLYAIQKQLPQEVELAKREFIDMVQVLDVHLTDREFLVGQTFSAADIVCGYTLDWANEVGLLDRFPTTRSYMERLYERPKAPRRIAAALSSISQ